jgi:hypothetical protein
MGAFGPFLQEAREADQKKRRKELLAIVNLAMGISSTLSSQKPNIKVLFLKDLSKHHGVPEHDRFSFHGMLDVKGDDQDDIGNDPEALGWTQRGIDLVIEPAIVRAGTAEGTLYDQETVLHKAVVWMFQDVDDVLAPALETDKEQEHKPKKIAPWGGGAHERPISIADGNTTPATLSSKNTSSANGRLEIIDLEDGPSEEGTGISSHQLGERQQPRKSVQDQTTFQTEGASNQLFEQQLRKAAEEVDDDCTYIGTRKKSSSPITPVQPPTLNEVRSLSQGPNDFDIALQETEQLKNVTIQFSSESTTGHKRKYKEDDDFDELALAEALTEKDWKIISVRYITDVVPLEPCTDCLLERGKPTRYVAGGRMLFLDDGPDVRESVHQVIDWKWK